MKKTQNTAIVPITETTAELIPQPTRKRDNRRYPKNSRLTTAKTYL